MKSLLKAAAALSLAASFVMAGGPDSAMEVSPEFGGQSIFKGGYQTYKMKIEGIDVQDFFDANDFFAGSKFSLMSDDFSETYMSWKVGFTLNSSDDQDDIFHAGITLGYSSLLEDEEESLGYFFQIGAEYYDGSSSGTFYTSDIGMNFKATDKFYVTPFVGMITDDDFNKIKGEGGLLLTYRVTEEAAASIKYTHSDIQKTATLGFSYIF